MSLGTHPFAAGTAGSVLVRTTATDGYVVVDAVKFQPVDALPTVSLWATNASASEPFATSAPTAPGIVTILRTGDTTSPLTVELTLGGSALNGVDYAAVPLTVTIPAKSAYARVAFHPQADLRAEGTETITVGLAPAADYAISETLASAVVRIADRPFDAWRKAHFTPAQLDDPEVSGDFADADADGLSTLAEFVGQGDPTVPDYHEVAAGRVVSADGQGHASLVFTRPKSGDVLVTPQISLDLQTWRSDSGALAQVVLDDDGRTQKILARDVLPLDGPAHFLRVKIERAK